jgi:hypothetical protein
MTARPTAPLPCGPKLVRQSWRGTVVSRCRHSLNCSAGTVPRHRQGVKYSVPTVPRHHRAVLGARWRAVDTTPPFCPVLSRHALPMHVPDVRKAAVGPPSQRYAPVRRTALFNTARWDGATAGLCSHRLVPSFPLPHGGAASHCRSKKGVAIFINPCCAKVSSAPRSSAPHRRVPEPAEHNGAQ